MRTVQFKTANLAFEKGFEQNTLAYYYKKDKVKDENQELGNYCIGDLGSHTDCYLDAKRRWKDNDLGIEIIPAPTLEQLHEWLIYTHGIYIIVIPTVTANWTYHSVKVVSKVDEFVIKGIESVSDLPLYTKVSGEDFDTNRDALETGIYQAMLSLK